MEVQRRSRDPWWLALYGFLAGGAHALLEPRLRRRYGEGYDERRGEFQGPLVDLGATSPLWIHAVSVGEVQAAAPLVQVLREDTRGTLPVVLSTITPTGRAMARSLLEGQFDALVYYPWDVPSFVEKALGALRPRGYMVVETEIWPTLLFALRRRHIPAFLVNGRISPRTFERSRRWRFAWNDVFDAFEGLFMRSEEDAERILALGAPRARVRVLGDCKVEALLRRREAPGVLPVTPPSGGPVFLAGSTHPGEEGVVLEAFRRLRKEHPSSRLVLVPRHPERGEAVCQWARAVGRAELLSANPENWTILVVDRVGYLFALYRWAQGAFVGGSLVPKGGQNLLEPVAWGVPVARGPHMEDFAEGAGALERLGATRTVTDAASLAEAWRWALTDEGKAAGHRGRAYVEGLGGAASATWHEVAFRLGIRRA